MAETGGIRREGEERKRYNKIIVYLDIQCCIWVSNVPGLYPAGLRFKSQGIS